MTIRIGINGFGRIGRIIFRAAQNRSNIKVVAINDLLEINYLAYILKYDSTHGRFQENIKIHGDYLIINNNKIRIFSERDPIHIKWKEVGVDIVAEATGIFLNKEVAQKHIIAGAKKVVLTAPPYDDIPMFVKGVNFETYNGQDIVSNASCTTNCLAPLVKVIHDRFGIIEGLVTTVHAVTVTQKTIDSTSRKNWRSGRGALQNIIPSTTGAATSLGKIIPELNGKFNGIALRVPVPNVSVVDLTAKLNEETCYEEIKKSIQIASQGIMKGVIAYITDDVVSSDFNGEICTSIFDSKASILLNNNFVKLIAWYDNETGYSNKVLDLISHIYEYKS